MSIKDRFKNISLNASIRTEQDAVNNANTPTNPRKPRTAPGMAAAASRLFSEERQQLLDEIEELRKKLAEVSTATDDNPEHLAEITRLRQELQAKESAYGIKMIKVADCHTKPATDSRPLRKRKLSEKDFEALRISIVSVGMSVPIQVEPRKEGGYWVVAGHNRTKVHEVENIEEIRAEVVNPEVVDVEAAALVSNLLTPELGTYEFYRGIKYFRDELGKSSKEIAEITGRGKSTISEYFCLDSFPKEALDFLEESNLQIGSSAVAQLSKLITPENTQAIVKALSEVAAGKPWKTVYSELTAAQSKKKESKETGAEVIKIQREGRSFAVLSYRNNNLSIRFASKRVPSDLAEKIKKLLEESDS